MSDPESLFKSWLVEHRGAVLKVARAYTLTAEDCQDLAQEILLQVWRSLPQFQGQGQRHDLVLPGGAEHRARLAPQGTPPADPATTPPRRRKPAGLRRHRPDRQRELVERLYAAIRRLPGADAALVLLHLDGLSYRQMAEVLGVSEGNVGVKLNRAKKALGELMKEEPHEP